MIKGNQEYNTMIFFHCSCREWKSICSLTGNWHL